MPSNELRTTLDVDEPQSPGARRENLRARLAYSRLGAGEPLVLLHGQGLSRRSWDPVVADLARERDVIAVDLPGHGDSPRQPRSAGNTPLDQAHAVAELLDELGLASVHVAGNSVGGWVALELGRLQRARTVTALAPGGLWGGRAPVFVRATMRQSRVSARIVRRLAPDAPRTRLARALFMAQMSGHPSRVPYAVANQAIHDMATAPGFRETLRAAESTGFRNGAAIRVPVTVAFGSRDRAIPPVLARRREELPPQTRWIEIKSAGHVAMFDQPGAVVALLLHASGPRAGEPIRQP
jgi:pimeloyl-ACP methyl ester carboxylesterase